MVNLNNVQKYDRVIFGGQQRQISAITKHGNYFRVKLFGDVYVTICNADGTEINGRSEFSITRVL